ncbi:hypothetical protein AVEN_19909-1 [Araneus ventricosus]|uniref:Uncharacterized protein n=1 Tax=Araneus ventricosus TaxID=182803 RepID=A0A4Y2UUR9_ARAVE|nr:hypothetical protein AVEN_19909-1 [Araneus ventricosus]
MGDFRFLERARSPFRPDFSSLTPTQIPPPQCSSPHTADLSPATKDHISLFMAERDELKSNVDGFQNSPSVYVNYHRAFALTNRFGILCSKKSGLEHW